LVGAYLDTGNGREERLFLYRSEMATSGTGLEQSILKRTVLKRLGHDLLKFWSGDTDDCSQRRLR
jgi:hypothetical protein